MGKEGTRWPLSSLPAGWLSEKEEGGHSSPSPSLLAAWDSSMVARTYRTTGALKKDSHL